MSAVAGDVADAGGERLAEFTHAGQPVVLRTWRPGDERELVACYNAVFPVDDPAQLPQSLALWHWKFDPAPSGGRREIVLAEHPEHGVLGAYPCQPLRAWVDGEERRTSQIVDLMVRHAFRRVGPRPGLFVQLGRAFYARYCGGARDRQLFNYGWPVPAWRVGQRYLDYQNVRDWSFLAREIEVDPARLRQDPVGVETRVAPARATAGLVTPAELDALWLRLRSSFALTIVRDATWFDWRYAQHPERSYELVTCRDRGAGSALRGIAVYAVGDFLRPRTSFLVDWLVDAGDTESQVALVGACERLARRDETGVLAMVLNPADPRFQAVQRLGFRWWDTRYFLVAASFGPDLVWLRDHWTFTMGESDLV
ncbi:MAG: hypothetical protein IPM29_05285 [Planctomycetes bacterium]|nr:hypothetical protein [Planctomycetota bacterium]